MQREYIKLSIEEVVRYMSKEDILAIEDIIKRFERNKADKIHEKEELERVKNCNHLNKRPDKRTEPWSGRDTWVEVCEDCGEIFGKFYS